MGIFELNLTMPEDFLLLAIIPSELYVFGHIFGRSKSYRKALPSRCSSQLELSGTLSPISGLFYSGGGEKIHFQAQSACNYFSSRKILKISGGPQIPYDRRNGETPGLRPPKVSPFEDLSRRGWLYRRGTHSPRTLPNFSFSHRV